MKPATYMRATKSGRMLVKNARGEWKHTVCDTDWQGVDEYHQPYDMDEPIDPNNPDSIGEGIAVNPMIDHNYCLPHQQLLTNDREAHHYRGGSSPTPPPEQLDLRILRSCRQLYNECSEILWASNLFYFDHPEIFACFVNRCTPAQKASIRKLYLTVDRRYPGQWREVLKVDFAQSLQGLRELHFCAAANFVKSLLPSLMESDSLLSAHMSPITVFRLLPLSHAHVRLLHNWSATEETWTRTDRRSVEGRLEKLLLEGATAEACQEQTEARELKLPEGAFRL